MPSLTNEKSENQGDSVASLIGKSDHDQLWAFMLSKMFSLGL